jgi:hypothetical protein
MATICEYTTVSKVKSYKDTQSTLTATDSLILDMIRQACREVEDITNRWFFPRIQTRTYDTPKMGAKLLFNGDLLELTTLTNGDGIAIPSSDYKLYPLNDWPKRELVLLPKRYSWQMDSYGTPYGAISAVGVFGYQEDYLNAWSPVTLLSTAITTAGQTTVTVPTGTVSAGDLLQLESEYIYALSVQVGATDTIGMVRGVNGSTAAAHIANTVVNRWDCGAEIEMLVRRAATAYTKLRANPTSETVNVDGVQFVTPKDVLKWMDQQLRSLGEIRVGIG